MIDLERPGSRSRRDGLARPALLGLVAVAACSRQPLDEIDELYWDWGDRRVLCAANLDDSAGNELDDVRSGLARAAAEREVISLYAHRPGGTVPVEKIEAVLGEAGALGLDLVTYDDLAAGGPRRGALSLSFDDAHVDEWFALREAFDRASARVTFFVSRYDLLSEDRVDKLRQLRDEGHAIAAHGLRHRDAPAYVEEEGLAAYLADEADPSIDLLRRDGFDPIAFAYPFGARTGELDRALLERVALVRSVTFSIESPLLADPCPE